MFYRLGGGGSASGRKAVVTWVSISLVFASGDLATGGVEGGRGSTLLVTSNGGLLLLSDRRIHGLLLLVRQNLATENISRTIRLVRVKSSYDRVRLSNESVTSSHEDKSRMVG